MAAIAILSYKRPILLKRLLASFLLYAESLENITSLYVLDSSPIPIKDNIISVFNAFRSACPIDCFLYNYSPDLPPSSKLLDALICNIQSEYIQICADDDLYYFDKIDSLCDIAESNNLDYIGGIDLRYDSNDRLSYKLPDYPFDTIFSNYLTRIKRITNSPFPVAYGLFKRESLIPIQQHVIRFSSRIPDKSFAEYCKYISCYLQLRVLIKPLVTQLRDTRPAREWDFSTSNTVRGQVSTSRLHTRFKKLVKHILSGLLFPWFFISTLPPSFLKELSFLELLCLYFCLFGFSFKRLLSSFRLYRIIIPVIYIDASDSMAIQNLPYAFDVKLLNYLSN